MSSTTNKTKNSTTPMSPVMLAPTTLDWKSVDFTQTMRSYQEPVQKPIVVTGTLQGPFPQEVDDEMWDEIDEYEQFFTNRLGYDPALIGGTAQEIADYKRRREQLERKLDAAVYTSSKK